MLIYTAQRGGSRNNMRRWWRLGKVVCTCIDHKYAFVLICMHTYIHAHTAYLEKCIQT